MKACPFCAEQINDEAVICRFCSRGLPANQAAVASRGTNDWGRVGLIVGGILIAVSPFMAWASVVLLGTFNLFQLLEFDRVNSSNGLWVSAVGVFFVLSGISFPERVRRAVSVVGGALASLAAWGVLEKLVTAIRQAEGFARVEIGPYIALSGSGVVLVAGLVRLLSKPRTPDPNGRRPIPTTAKAQRFTR